MPVKKQGKKAGEGPKTSGKAVKIEKKRKAKPSVKSQAKPKPKATSSKPKVSTAKKKPAAPKKEAGRGALLSKASAKTDKAAEAKSTLKTGPVKKMAPLKRVVPPKKMAKTVQVAAAKKEKRNQHTTGEGMAPHKPMETTTIMKNEGTQMKITAEQVSLEKKLDAPASDLTMVGSLGFLPYALKKEEEYMNDQQLLHFRNILLKWKNQLLKGGDSTVVHMKEEMEAFPDPLDRAAQEEGFTLELRTRDRERKLIKKIDAALERIDEGEYGYCEDCGADIGVRRLEARPTATKCIDCKTFQEIREKQEGI